MLLSEYYGPPPDPLAVIKNGREQEGKGKKGKAEGKERVRKKGGDSLN